jgi:hypothetical protein
LTEKTSWRRRQTMGKAARLANPGPLTARNWPLAVFTLALVMMV